MSRLPNHNRAPQATRAPAIQQRNPIYEQLCQALDELCAHLLAENPRGIGYEKTIQALRQQIPSAVAQVRQTLKRATPDGGDCLSYYNFCSHSGTNYTLNSPHEHLILAYPKAMRICTAEIICQSNGFTAKQTQQQIHHWLNNATCYRKLSECGTFTVQLNQRQVRAAPLPARAVAAPAALLARPARHQQAAARAAAEPDVDMLHSAPNGEPDDDNDTPMRP